MLDKSHAARVVEQFLNALDGGDVAGALAGLADDVLIVDDVAPFRRVGIATAEAWLKEVIGARKRLQMSLSLADRTRCDVGDGRIYIVARGNLSITSAGGSAEESGVLTFTLRDVEGSWMIDTIVWSVPA